jgi:hypothetical protein
MPFGAVLASERILRLYPIVGEGNRLDRIAGPAKGMNGAKKPRRCYLLYKGRDRAGADIPADHAERARSFTL